MNGVDSGAAGFGRRPRRAGARNRGPARNGGGAEAGSARLSGADAAFLYLERKEIPLNIGCVSLFEGPIPMERFIGGIASRLHMVPRCTQIAVSPVLNVGGPVWQDDPNFDIRRHVVPVVLDPPGGEAELAALAGRLFGNLMDRRRPLWDLHVVEGLAGGRGGLILRLHHAMADGVSGAAFLQAVFEMTADSARPAGKPHFRPGAGSPPVASVVDVIGNAVHGALDNLLAAEEGILEMGHAILSDSGQRGLLGLSGLLPELAGSVERLPFNRRCGGERRFCWGELDLESAHAIRAAAGGGTLNDVLLTVLTRATARYAKVHGETVRKRYLRVVCPVNVRSSGQASVLGNRITFLPVALPMDVQDPLQMLRGVASRTEIMKNSRAADLVTLAGSWLGVAPAPLQAAFWRALPNVIFPLPLFNIICTNIPGSPVPLYAAGRRMTAMYPQVPTGYELGIGCAALSYAGKLFFGLTADAHAAPDAGRLRNFILASFQELCRAAGVKKARPAKAEPAADAAPSRARPRRTKAAAPSAVEVPAEVVADAERVGAVEAVRRRRVKRVKPAAAVEEAAVVPETAAPPHVAAEPPAAAAVQSAAVSAEAAPEAAPVPDPLVLEAKSGA